jgi:hypothetical protein
MMQVCDPASNFHAHRISLTRSFWRALSSLLSAHAPSLKEDNYIGKLLHHIRASDTTPSVTRELSDAG